MAITLDATAQSGEATDFQTSFSFNHTLGSGSNRVVFVGIAGRQGGSGSAIPTPTYNSVNMTLVSSVGWTTASNQCCGIWVIKDASLPAAGTYAVAVTMADSDSSSYGVVAASYTGVDQTTPTDNANSGTGSDSTPTVTFTSATDDMVITVNELGNDPAGTTMVCDGTEIVRNTVVSPDTHQRCIMQTKPGGASVTMAPTQNGGSGQSAWREAGSNVNAATGGGGGGGLMWLH